MTYLGILISTFSFIYFGDYCLDLQWRVYLNDIHSNGISKGGKHISDGGRTIYNDNIHHNIFRSYNYNKIEVDIGMIIQD